MLRLATALVMAASVTLGSPAPVRAAPAQGDAPLSLEDLLNIRLSASSFFEVSRESAPGTTYVIDRRNIATSPSRTLADTIEMSVPGMQIAKHLWTGAVIGVRGITIDNNAKTLVMIDGLNLNQRTHFGTHGLLSLPLMEDVESMEVSNGPGALVHGSGAINGYINLTPKDGASHRGWEAVIEAGPVEASGSAQLSYGMSYGSSNANNLFLYAGFAGAAGFTPRTDLAWSCTGPTPNRTTNDVCPHESIKARDMGPSFKLTANWNHGGLNVLGLFSKAQLSTEGNALDDWFNFEDPYWLSTIFALRPRYTWSFSDQDDLVLSLSTELQDYGFVTRHPRRSEMTADPTMPIIWNGPPRGARESWGSLRALWKTIRFPMHSLAIGAEVGQRRFERNRHFFGEAADLIGFEDADFHWTEMASFFEDTFVWKNLTLTGGLRFEYFMNPHSFQADAYTYIEADTRETVTPKPVAVSDQQSLVKRIGVAWAITGDTTLKASFQQGFRNPDASYYTHWAAREAIKVRANKAGLRPLVNETMDSVEVNLSQTIDPTLVWYLNGYYNRYQNLLAWIAKEEAFLNGPDDIKSVGGEIGSDVVTGGLRLGASYAHSRPVGYSDLAYSLLALTNTDLGPGGAAAGGHTSWKVFSPHQVKLSVGQSLLGDRLSWTLAGAFYSKVDDPRWAAGQDHRWLLNAAAKFHLSAQVYAKLVIQNLTGNTVPASRIDNDLTQVGNLGIERRLVYLSLGLQAP